MNERSIFLAALEIADPARRAAYLDQACGADAALRQRAESLLKAHERVGSFLDQPAMGSAQTGDYYPEAASTPTPLTESRAAPRFAPGTILAGRYPQPERAAKTTVWNPSPQSRKRRLRNLKNPKPRRQRSVAASRRPQAPRS